MRSITAGGMCCALDDLGLLLHVDLVVGSSGGALSGGYVLSHRSADGCASLWTHLLDRSWINPRGLLRRDVVGLDWLFSEIFGSAVPMDYTRIVTDGRLRVVVSDLSRRGARVLAPSTPEEAQSALRAAISVPGMTQHGVLCDAMLYERIPSRSALAIGATHAIILRSAPAPMRPRPLDARLLQSWGGQAEMVRPVRLLRPWCQDPSLLRAAALDGYASMCRALSRWPDDIELLAHASASTRRPSRRG